jgi:hypothetical protein
MKVVCDPFTFLLLQIIHFLLPSLQRLLLGDRVLAVVVRIEVQIGILVLGDFFLILSY